MEIMSLLAGLVAIYLVTPAGTTRFERSIVVIERKLDNYLIRDHEKMHLSVEEMSRMASMHHMNRRVTK